MSLARFDWVEGELVIRDKDFKDNGKSVTLSEVEAAQLLEYLSCRRVGDVEALMMTGASRARCEGKL